ncbi:SusC/RagA family TonB-linked outer membrane protein [Rubrivirga sp. S365]|uniref:SusC/RagA family TonB-linked outer membrane protein n=1 Tax=Rubrivirga litoralis TaxID=3075598 RepID=A0ABU3BU42_9BACT|nr:MULTISPECIES: SusC/RagA family TonB-linked outer membrane protein [unclassified Rubrivirga]MDT0632809.1 SusC/RagA family TonB-linked outer membrane protein [Rubrivirga sp. F394]MDT7857500.1 SusC/RagA family TonB-linked outer membrane protein [Rubrivirga sp. S365]
MLFATRVALATGLLVLLAAAHPARAQERAVTGTVTDAETGAPLAGVNVVAGTPPVGTSTDADGGYRLDVPAGADSLVFSFIGYERLAVAVDGRAVVDVALAPASRVFDDVVVTALGIEREERELGYSVQQIDAADLQEADTGNLVSALSGRVAGAQVIDTGGAPGQGARIILRGITSLDPNADNQPLFVVDGVPIDNSTDSGAEGFNSRGFSNRAVDLNPNDVASVNVLKGAAATTLYGVRAANGAVIVTTKRGRAGTTRVEVTSEVGAEGVNRTPEVQQVYTQGFGGAYDPTSFWCCWGAPIDEARQVTPDLQFYNNWEQAYQTGYTVENNVSVSGGTDAASFYASVGRLDNGGVLPFSDWARTSARLSGAVQPSAAFRFGGTLNYVNSGGDRVFADRFNERLVYWTPNQDVAQYIKPNGTMFGYYGSDDNVGTNALYDARFATYNDDVDRLIGSVNAGYTFAEGVDVTYRLGVDTYSDSRFETLQGPQGIAGENALDSEGEVGETRISSRDLTSTLNVSLSRRFGDKLQADLLLGNDVFGRSYDRVNVSGSDLTIPNFYTLSNARDLTTSQFVRDQRLVGLYGDLKLAYDETLYLSLTGRNDWTSTLPVESRSFFYPSLSLAYVFTETLGSSPVLEFGKVRASFSQVGKDAPPYATNVTFVSPGAFPLDGQTGFTQSGVLGSPDLKPERTTSFEAGVDLRFLGGRVGLDATYYNATSRDQIIPVPISNATGFSRFITNAGSIRNTGVELVLNAAVVETSDVGWDVTANFARNRNEVVEIREGIETIEVGRQSGYAGSTAYLRLLPDAPYGAIYGTSYARYYAPGEDADPLELDPDRPLLIGADGFPVVDRTLRILGNMTPDWIGGLLNRVRYKNVELSALIDVSFGAEKYSQFNNFFAAFGIPEYTLDREDTMVFEGTTADGQPNAQPVYLGQGAGPDGRDYGAGYYRNTYRASTENSVFDASYVKLRNVSLAYGLPASLVGRAGIDRARIRLAVNNVVLWSPYPYWDPEVTSAGSGSNATGFSGLAHPGVASYTLTLELGI